jgi:predicted transcriptional regulator
MRRPVLPQLGELERLVLAQLWSEGPADVKTMHRAIGEARGIRPNTIQSTLERLHRKGLAARIKQGRAYSYRARISRREWVARSLEGLLGAVPGADAALLLSTFVDLAERAGADHLEELERLVRERRAREGEVKG